MSDTAANERNTATVEQPEPFGVTPLPFSETSECWYVCGNRVHVATAAKYIGIIQFVLTLLLSLWVTSCLLTAQVPRHVPVPSVNVVDVDDDTGLQPDMQLDTIDLHNNKQLSQYMHTQNMYVVTLVICCVQLVVDAMLLVGLSREHSELLLPYLCLTIANTVLSIFYFQPISIIAGLLQLACGLVVYKAHKFYAHKQEYRKQVQLGPAEMAAANR